jgi:hypothetical protein
MRSDDERGWVDCPSQIITSVVDLPDWVMEKVIGLGETSPTRSGLMKYLTALSDRQCKKQSIAQDFATNLTARRRASHSYPSMIPDS